MTCVSNIVNLGNFRIIAYLYVGDSSRRDSAKVQKKRYSIFIYNKAEPQAMYGIYKQTRKLCVLQHMSFMTAHE